MHMVLTPTVRRILLALAFAMALFALQGVGPGTGAVSAAPHEAGE